MKNIILIILALIVPLTSAFGWSKKGHDVICYIAETHLEEDVRMHIEEILGGRSIIYYANWMDGASNTRKYSHTKGWHYLNIERGKTLKTTKRAKDGDLLTALTSIEEQLRSGELSKEGEFDALRFFIHLVGDLHQPMHLGRVEDRGGNEIPVVYFIESTSLHSLWDYHIVEGSHDWSYTEWQIQIDRPTQEERSKILEGDYTLWIEQTHQITEQIYRDTPAETRIFYEYIDLYRPIVEGQLLSAGLRLADLLNEIYSSRESGPSH